MNETLIVCLTVLLVVFGAGGMHLYLTLTERKRAREESATAADVSERLADALLRLNSTQSLLFARLDQHAEQYRLAQTEAAETVRAQLSAYSERMVTFEAALRHVVAEIVNVTGYSAERFRQLQAATVRGAHAQKPGPRV